MGEEALPFPVLDKDPTVAVAEPKLSGDFRVIFPPLLDVVVEAPAVVAFLSQVLAEVEPS